MIIFGTRGVKMTQGEGEFHCPQCATKRRYKHRKVRRFFTLYFIPVIPLDSLGEYVECQTCKGTFVPRILEYKPGLDTNDFQSEYEKAMRHSMILMMLADGHIDEEEKKVVMKIINKFGHNDIDSEQLNQLIADVERNNEPIETYLSKIAPSLNEHGKELIIKCGLSVASADGHIDESEIQMIKKMATAMEMSGSHLKGIIQEMMSPDSQAA